MKESILEIKVIPNAAINAFVGWEGKVLKLRIHAPAEKGKANEELIEFLSKLLGIRKAAIILLKGQSSRKKTVKIYGIDFAEIKNKLAT